MHCRMFSKSPASTHYIALDYPSSTTEFIARHNQISPGDKSTPLLKTSRITLCSRDADLSYICTLKFSRVKFLKSKKWGLP